MVTTAIADAFLGLGHSVSMNNFMPLPDKGLGYTAIPEPLVEAAY